MTRWTKVRRGAVQGTLVGLGIGIAFEVILLFLSAQSSREVTIHFLAILLGYAVLTGFVAGVASSWAEKGLAFIPSMGVAASVGTLADDLAATYLPTAAGYAFAGGVLATGGLLVLIALTKTHED